MEEENIKPKKMSPLALVSALVLIVAVVGVSSWWFGRWFHNPHQMHAMAMEGMAEMSDHRQAFVEHRDYIIQKKLAEGEYTCCLEKPCVTCVGLDPYHGEGASCTCLEDLVNHEAPCGECVGGIIAGRGNKYLANYFARSLADEMGEENLDALKELMAARYDIEVENQD